MKFQLRTVCLTTETSSLRGIQFPFFSIAHSFQSQHPLQIYNMARNLSRPLAKWQHQLVSLVETEQLCQNNAAWKTLRTQLDLGKMWQWLGAEDSLFSPRCEFPLSNYSCKKAQRRSSSHYNRGRNQIAQFPIRSLVEIWNNNPHQGLAMSFNFPIQWTMARNQPSLSV